MTQKNDDKMIWWIWGVGGFAIIALIIFLIFALRSSSDLNSEPRKKSSVAGQEGTPIAKLNEKFFNAGPLKNKTDVVVHDFTLSNDGKSDLIVNKLTTSCHCTTAQLTYDGESSQKWGMASGSGWQVAIRPGETATITVEYDPKKMISEGLIKRGIYIGTNDPNQPEIVYELDVENNL